VLCIEDAHMMDERSWEVVLSLTDEDAPSLILLTHEAAATLQDKEDIPPVSVKVARGVVGMGSAGLPLTAAMHDGTFAHLSWASTLASLRTLKRKCAPSDHLALDQVTLGDVQTRLASVLAVPTTNIDPQLTARVHRLCRGEPFWLEEVLVSILEHGLAEVVVELDREPSPQRSSVAVSAMLSGKSAGGSNSARNAALVVGNGMGHNNSNHGNGNSSHGRGLLRGTGSVVMDLLASWGPGGDSAEHQALVHAQAQAQAQVLGKRSVRTADAKAGTGTGTGSHEVVPNGGVGVGAGAGTGAGAGVGGNGSTPVDQKGAKFSLANVVRRMIKTRVSAEGEGLAGGQQGSSAEQSAVAGAGAGAGAGGGGGGGVGTAANGSLTARGAGGLAATGGIIRAGVGTGVSARVAPSTGTNLTPRALLAQSQPLTSPRLLAGRTGPCPNMLSRRFGHSVRDLQGSDGGNSSMRRMGSMFFPRLHAMEAAPAIAGVGRGGVGGGGLSKRGLGGAGGGFDEVSLVVWRFLRLTLDEQVVLRLAGEWG
jgi:hypothetical protein